LDAGFDLELEEGEGKIEGVDARRGWGVWLIEKFCCAADEHAAIGELLVSSGEVEDD